MYINVSVIVFMLLALAYLYNWLGFTYWVSKLNIHFLTVIFFLMSLALVWPLVLIGLFTVILVNQDESKKLNVNHMKYWIDLNDDGNDGYEICRYEISKEYFDLLKDVKRLIIDWTDDVSWLGEMEDNYWDLKIKLANDDGQYAYENEGIIFFSPTKNAVLFFGIKNS